MKRLNPAELERIDALLDGQDEHLLAGFDQCWQSNENPNTGGMMRGRRPLRAP